MSSTLQKVEIGFHWSRGYDLLLVGLVGIGFGVAGIAFLSSGQAGQDAKDILPWIVPVVLVGGAFCINSGISRVQDRSNQLTVNEDGLLIHRTGTLIEWSVFRGVRTYIEQTNGAQTSATLVVTVRREAGFQEILIDAHPLALPVEVIANHIRKHAMIAAESQFTGLVHSGGAVS